MNVKLMHSTIQFNVDERKVKFDVYHNLPEIQGISLEDALISWTVRTKDYTASSLCKYIMSKNTGHVCFTKKQFNKLKKK